MAVLIEQIKEVRPGKNTDTLRNVKDLEGCYQDACIFSIIFGENFESLDLIANSADEANIWVTGLTCLVTGRFKGGQSIMMTFNDVNYGPSRVTVLNLGSIRGSSQRCQFIMDLKYTFGTDSRSLRIIQLEGMLQDSCLWKIYLRRCLFIVGPWIQMLIGFGILVSISII